MKILILILVFGLLICCSNTNVSITKVENDETQINCIITHKIVSLIFFANKYLKKG